MMPPPPQDSPAWFIPYLYTPSKDAGYTKLVTPLGSIHIPFELQDEFLNIIIAIVVVAFSVGAWRACTSKRTTSPAPAKAATKSAKASSALEENIQTKGANSYYYAHQRRTGSTNSDDNSLKKTKVSTYSWTDDKKTVSIYLTDDVVADMEDEQLQLNWTETSLSMDLLVASGSKLAKSLVISTLYGEITNVTWKRRKSQLVITLFKKDPAPWKSLNGAAKKIEEHIEYDESLYD